MKLEEVLREIRKYYNPLGDKHNFLVDEFLVWAQKKGSFYWIWDGAVEVGNGVFSPKLILKELPFSGLGPSTTYQEILEEEWLEFLDQPPYRENLIEEYKFLTEIYQQ